MEKVDRKQSLFSRVEKVDNNMLCISKESGRMILNVLTIHKQQGFVVVDMLITLIKLLHNIHMNKICYSPQICTIIIN